MSAFQEPTTESTSPVSTTPSSWSSLSPEQQAVLKELDEHCNIWFGEKPNYPAIFERLSHNHPSFDIKVIAGNDVMALGRIPRHEERREDGTPYYISLRTLATNWVETEEVKKYSVKYLSYTAAADEQHLYDTVFNMTDYSKNVYKSENYWFVDFACTAPTDEATIKTMMPFIVAACGSLVSVHVPGYDEDAITGISRALSNAFKSNRAWKYFRADSVPTFDSERWIIPDPTTLNFTDEADRPYVAALAELCTRVWPAAYEANWNSPGNNYRTWSCCTPTLVYGQTAAFTWVMNYYCGLVEEDPVVVETAPEVPLEQALEALTVA